MRMDMGYPEIVMRLKIIVYAKGLWNHILGVDSSCTQDTYIGTTGSRIFSQSLGGLYIVP